MEERTRIQALSPSKIATIESIHGSDEPEGRKTQRIEAILNGDD